MTKVSLSAIGVLIAVSAAAQSKSPVGEWTGKTKILEMKIPATATPAERKAMDDAAKAIARTNLKLKVTKDGKFSLYSPEVDLGGGAKWDAYTTTGTWKWVGRRLLISTKEPGSKTVLKEYATMSANGKVLTMRPNPALTAGIRLAMTFTRP